MLKKTGTEDTSRLNLLLWRIPYPKSRVYCQWGQDGVGQRRKVASLWGHPLISEQSLFENTV